jgi:hypothetical protein
LAGREMASFIYTIQRPFNFASAQTVILRDKGTPGNRSICLPTRTTKAARKPLFFARAPGGTREQMHLLVLGLGSQVLGLLAQRIATAGVLRAQLAAPPKHTHTHPHTHTHTHTHKHTHTPTHTHTHTHTRTHAHTHTQIL